MSFRLDLQSAPVADAIPGKPSAWSGASTSVVTVTGIYEGRTNETYTFTATAGGTIGSGTVTITWANTSGEAGRLDVGTGYTAGTMILFHMGISIAFGAGTATTTQTFTVVVVASRGFVAYQSVTADALPTDVLFQGTSQQSLDARFTTDSGSIRQREVAILRNPTLALEYLLDTQRKATDKMEHLRQEITVGEDYDSNTVFLLRPERGLMPIIGPRPTFSRSGIGSYTDADTGLLRQAATGIERHEAGKAGRGIVLDVGGSTNVLIVSQGSSSSVIWVAAVGAPVLTYDTLVHPPLDPEDTNWDFDFRRGSVRTELNATEAVVQSTITINVSSNYVAQLYIRGRGKVTVGLYMGAGSPSTLKTSQQITPDGGNWQRVVLASASNGTDNRATIRVTGDDESVVWLGPAQLEEGAVATSYIQCTAGSLSRGAESLTFALKPPPTGSLGFWIKMPLGAPVGVYRLLETNTGGLWGIRYDATTPGLAFYTDAAGQLNAVQSLGTDAWHHICATWKRSVTANQIDRVLYLDGGQVAADSTASWNLAWGGVIELGRSGGTAAHHITYDEIRIDSVAWSATTVSDIYNRLVRNDWLHLHSMFGGRRYRISGASYTYINEVNPDKLVATLPLTQSSVEEDALIVAR